VVLFELFLPSCQVLAIFLELIPLQIMVACDESHRGSKAGKVAIGNRKAVSGTYGNKRSERGDSCI
jgi:hypothetical protein